MKQSCFIAQRLSLLFVFFFCYEAYAQSQTAVGKITYYSEAFHGRYTSSGERFNMHDLTAAHPYLPFGTLLKVTNLVNKKSVIVRVNDRGPFGGGGFILDVSKAAAQKIDLVRSGTTRARIEVVASTEAKTRNFPTESLSAEKFRVPGLYTIYGHRVHPGQKFGLQIGAFATFEQAREVYKNVHAQGYEKVFLRFDPQNKAFPYKIIMGIYESEEISRRNLAEIQQRGLDGFPVKYQ